MIIFNWKNISFDLRLPIISIAVLLIAFYNKLINFIQTKFGKLSELTILLFPTAINILLYYIFIKYKIKFDKHWLILIELSGITPLLYNFASKIAAHISYILFFLWSILFFNMENLGGTILKLLSLLCLCGFIFGIAELVSYSKRLEKISRIWKLLSVYLASIILFALTINVFDNYNYFDIGVYIYNSLYAHGFFLLTFYLITISILLYNILYSFIRSRSFHLENCVAFISIFLPTIAYLWIDNYFVTNPPQYYTAIYDKVIWVLFNGFYIFFIAFIFLLSYRKKNNKIMKLGFTLTALLILSKCFSPYFNNLRFW
jgi:hypothetical protein